MSNEEKNTTKKSTTNNKTTSKKTSNSVKENAKETDSKYDTISLKEIREALETKVDKSQKKSVIKDVLINLIIAVIMLVYLGTVIMIKNNNTPVEVLEKFTKIATLGILFFGVVFLELSYQKDKSKLALNGVEVIVFGGSSLCLIYTIKLFYNNLVTVVSYITIGVICYYVLKSIVSAITSISKFKKANNDIKDIIDKKKIDIDDE